MGLRGTWWPGYAELVSDADAVLQSQVGGYDETSFGSKIMNEYKAVPPGAIVCSHKLLYFAVAAAPTRPVPMVTSEASSSSDVSKRSIRIIPPAKPPSPAPSAKSPRAATPPAPATAPPPATQLQSATAPPLLEPPAPTTPPKAEVPHYVARQPPTPTGTPLRTPRVKPRGKSLPPPVITPPPSDGSRASHAYVRTL